MTSDRLHVSLKKQAEECFKQGEWLRALRAIDSALDQDPSDTQLLNLRARAFEAMGQLEDALRSVDRCLEQQPDNVADLRNRGLVLLKMGRSAEALSTFDAVLKLAPRHVDVLVKRSYLLHHLDRRQEALESAERAVAAAPQDLHALNVRGMILDSFCRYEDARADFERILEADPNFADAVNNRGMIHARYGDFEKALECYNRSLELAPNQPQALYNRAMVRLALGEWEQGFREFESRWNIAPLEAARLYRLAPVWLGEEDLTGKTVLVHHEQGYGDSLQFVRYVPQVARLGAQVIVAVPLGLKRLMATLPGSPEVIAERDSVPKHDYCCPMMSLPLAFGTTTETVPADIPYLHAEPEKVRLWARRLGSRRRPRIGLVWSGRRYAPINHPRDMTLEMLRPLFSLAADFICLQTEMSEDDWKLLELVPQLSVFSEQLRDFSDTAGLIGNLDLVISVDTAVAHLAGAMGKPVWLMNRYASCWRWLQHRSDSPWYPSLRQFRQSKVGDWDGVVREVHAAAAMFIGNTAATETAASGGRNAASVQQAERIAKILTAALQEHQKGRHAQAISLYEEVLSISPDHPDALHYLGVALAQVNRSEDAIKVLARVIGLQPDNAHAHNHYANALSASARHEEALASYERTLKLKPRLADAFYNRGLALEKLGRTDEALLSYDEALGINPAYTAAYNNRGNVLVELKRYTAALESYERAIALRPEYLEAWINITNVLRMMHNYDRAFVSATQALKLGPDYAQAHSGFGAVLACIGRYDEALKEYERAIALNPDLADGLWNKAILHLSRGEFAQGWPLYEARWRVKSLKLSQRCAPQSQWDGQEPLQGKTVLLHAEQGYGDTIQFCRYAPLVANLGARVILGVPGALHKLMQSLKGVDRVVSSGAVPSFDVHCPLLSLPYAFGTDQHNIPGTAPYLRANAKRRKHWEMKLGERMTPRIGVVWSGKPTHSNDLRRSIALNEFAALFEVGATWVSLQKELRHGEAERLSMSPHVRRYGEDLADFADAAALIAELDLVLSVDTAVAHLAGALGRPVWILLPHVADWRWLQLRTDSPWYPTARLFRQSEPGDWASVLNDVGETLERFVSGAVSESEFDSKPVASAPLEVAHGETAPQSLH